MRQIVDELLDKGITEEHIIYINFEDYKYRKISTADALYEYVEEQLQDDEKVIEREFGAYEGIEDNYPKYVISMDRVPMSRNGVIHMSLVDFLMM